MNIRSKQIYALYIIHQKDQINVKLYAS